ncbi:hypothetical protein RJT34_08794 [Clitoria ternatea]|uniref:TFIIS N-terminal domain-containing protein n=1 Tax=Clitoria ternatea TaxID=43366 RepID=A0AAN9PSZ9_CLITE
MTLEDFFTLTEMKDGLTAPSRVQELVSVMQNEKDCEVKNAGDATRQWAAVASTIAATENKDCLDLFIQLDGLCFINRWLKDAENFEVDANDSFVEESITAMLRAVEKLNIDSEKLISSGIYMTICNLLDYRSSRVQGRAKVLFDSWKEGRNGDTESNDVGPTKVDSAIDEFVREDGQPSTVNEAGNDNDHASELIGSEKSLLRSPDNLVIPGSDNALQSSAIMECIDVKEGSANHLASVSSSAQEVAPLSLSTAGEATSVETCSLPVPNQGGFKGQSDAIQLNDLAKKERQDHNVNGPPEKCGAPEICSVSSKLEPELVSMGDSEAKIRESTKEPVLKQNVKSNEGDVCHKITVSGSTRTPGSDRRSELENDDDDDDCCSVALQNASVSESNLVKTEVLDMSSSGTEYVRASKEDKGHVNNDGKDTSKSSGSSKPGKDFRCLNIIDNRVSDNELDCGIVDALEVARLVAQDVYREVCSSGREYVRASKEGKGHVNNDGEDTSRSSDSTKPGKDFRCLNIIDKRVSDNELDCGIVDALEVARQVADVYREVCSSSSENISEGRIRQLCSPESIRNEAELTPVPTKEVSSRQSHTAGASAEEGHASISDNTETGLECRPDLMCLKVTEAAQDSGGNSEKHRCAFDLNEVSFGDMDVSVNTMSTPIPVVSVSRPAPTPGLPGAPLQFEGTLGWKGSAATSAFRPASPRKNSDSGKNLFVDRNSDNSKQRRDWLDFDLNVADGEVGMVKPVTESSGLPSGQSSVELSSKRSSRLEFDLNSIDDDGDTQPSDHRMEGQLFLARNGYWSPSPASSSSSMQPSVRNIDLNDRPYIQTDLMDQGPRRTSHIIDAYGRSRSSDAPVVSILGAKVEVGKKECIPQTLSLQNGNTFEPAIDLTMSRAGGVLGIAPTASFNHSSVFGYNGVASMSLAPSLPFSSAAYRSGGTIPYMVDSRGAPVVPQVGGSSSSVLPSYPQPPIIMNVTGTQLGLNGFGPSRPNFDLNSGFLIEGGNRDASATRQFFFPGQGRTAEEHARTLPQPSSSGVSGKRKEPDSGWESYPFSYKHLPPPWK